MLLDVAIVAMNIGIADVQLAPADQTVCDDKTKREELYKAQSEMAQNSGGTVPGSTEARIRAKAAVDSFFKRVDLLATKAKWTSEQKGQFVERVYNSPEVWALRHEPTQLLYRMAALKRDLISEGEPQRCRTFVEFLKIIDLINSNDERQVFAMDKLLDAEAQRLGISLK